MNPEISQMIAQVIQSLLQGDMTSNIRPKQMFASTLFNNHPYMQQVISLASDIADMEIKQGVQYSQNTIIELTRTVLSLHFSNYLLSNPQLMQEINIHPESVTPNVSKLRSLLAETEQFKRFNMSTGRNNQFGTQPILVGNQNGINNGYPIGGNNQFGNNQVGMSGFGNNNQRPLGNTNEFLNQNNNQSYYRRPDQGMSEQTHSVRKGKTYTKPAFIEPSQPAVVEKPIVQINELVTVKQTTCFPTLKEKPMKDNMVEVKGIMYPMSLITSKTGLTNSKPIVNKHTKTIMEADLASCALHSYVKMVENEAKLFTTNHILVTPVIMSEKVTAMVEEGLHGKDSLSNIIRTLRQFMSDPENIIYEDEILLIDSYITKIVNGTLDASISVDELSIDSAFEDYLDILEYIKENFTPSQLKAFNDYDIEMSNIIINTKEVKDNAVMLTEDFINKEEVKMTYLSRFVSVTSVYFGKETSFIIREKMIISYDETPWLYELAEQVTKDLNDSFVSIGMNIFRIIKSKADKNFFIAPI